MAYKMRKSGTITVGTTGGDGTGAAHIAIGLGAQYARLFGFEFKAISSSDTNTTLKLTDADGRIVFAATALDSTTDDSTTKITEQTTSTKGVQVYLGPVETRIYDQGGDPSANTEGQPFGVIVRSPVTATIGAGTDADTHAVNLLVEV